jgi:hypothetical protein
MEGLMLKDVLKDEAMIRKVLLFVYSGGCLGKLWDNTLCAVIPGRN